MRSFRTVKLLLIRHADAGEPGPNWPDDGQRPLTDEGRDQASRLGPVLGRLFPNCDVVCSTSLKRARETAAAIHPNTDWPKPIVHAADMWLPPRQLFESFTAYEKGCVAYVGHEPVLSRLISFLLTGNETVVVKMGKGAAAHLEVNDQPLARLLWLLVPEALP
ncbi:MAG: histidine phosphatase family protein [Actinomycetota bacterium]